MGNYEPKIIENRDFVALEEEDIQRLNRSEREKFERNPEIVRIMPLLEEKLGPGGRWEEHWLVIDDSGRRVYARIYYVTDRALALTSDARIIRELDFPPQTKGRIIHEP